MKRMMKTVYGFFRLFFVRIFSRGVKISLEQRRIENGVSITVCKHSKLYIGKNCNFRKYTSILVTHGGECCIGSENFFNRNVSITAIDSITIGNACKIANNVVIVDHDHNYSNANVGYVSSPVVIGDHVWIGANATILKGVKIGNNAVIAANSLVREDVPDFTVVGGNPAGVIKRIQLE